MQDFFYHKPTSLETAVSIFESIEDGVFLAGGQTILPVMKLGLAQPSDVIDLKAIGELTKINVTNNLVSIGAMSTHSSVSASKEIRKKIPGLAQLASLIGDVQVRNRGTIGGSLANNDPSADYPAALLALKGRVITNKRCISAEDFFVDMFETALEQGEIIIRIDFPITGFSAYAKFPNPISRYAIVGVFVSKTSDEVQLAVTGAGHMVFRALDFEKALRKDFSSNAIKNIAISADNLNTDIHASNKYRAHLINVMAKRAVEDAVNNGTTG